MTDGHRALPPVKAGDIVEVKAIRLNDDGDGVAPYQGFTLFVPGLLPGERATVRVARVESRFGRAVVEGRIEENNESVGRREPLCAVFGVCGGCQLQHLDYARQLEHKRKVVTDALARIAGLPNVPVLPTLGMANPWRYRNQVQIPLSFEPGKGYASGFFSLGSHRVVETPSCHLEPVEMEDTARRLVDVLNQLDSSGIVHHLIIRQSISNGQQMVVLCLRKDTALGPVVDAVTTVKPIVSLAKTIQPRIGGPVWGPTVEIVWGQSFLRESVLGLEYLISPRSFFQVNTEQASVLYQRALHYAQVSKADSVLDAYCGTGTMTLLFAKQARLAFGIETIAAAVKDAETNARHNGILNARFATGEVERVLPELVAKGERFDVVVLDPPRKGCHPDVVRAVLEARPKRIVYVSCNPATLARDLRLLTDGGYSVTEVQPVDMFPQTSHVECVASVHR